MVVLSLMRWLVVAAAVAGMPARAAAPSTTSHQPHPSATAIVLDVPDGPIRSQALADAEQIIAALAQQDDLIAVVDIREGLAVAQDFATAVHARDGVQRLRERSIWTYRHLAVSAGAAGPARAAHVASTLHSVAVDVARTGISGRIVLITDVASVEGGTRAHADTARMVRPLGVRVHVVGYQGVEADEGSLLGSTVTSTGQALQDCDPRRVACGLTEQVGQEARLDSAEQRATVARALARLAADTGGVFARTPQELAARLPRVSTPLRSTAVTRIIPDAPAWRVRDIEAATKLDHARLEYMHEPRALDVIRVPSAQGVRLVVVLQPTAVASVLPWYAFLRVRDERGLDLATFSEVREVGGAGDGPIIREVEVGAGQPVVYAMVGAANGTHVARQVVDTGDHTRAAGDLFLVGRLDAATPAQSGHPLASDGRLHVPLASSAVMRSSAAMVTAAIALPASAETSLLTVDLLSAGQRTRRTTLTVKGNTAVHVQTIALPLSSLADGAHEMRVSGEHEGRPWVRARHFEVVP
jgi:hypothetical protein